MTYRRVTRRATFDELPGDLRDRALAALERNHLPAPTEPGWVTHSENPPSTTFFGKLLGRRANSVDPNHEMAAFVFLVSGHLLLASRGDHSGCSASIAPIARVQMERVKDTPTASYYRGDDGLRLHGFPNGEGGVGSMFFGLGPGADADACEAAIRAACEDARARA